MEHVVCCVNNLSLKVASTCKAEFDTEYTHGQKR